MNKVLIIDDYITARVSLKLWIKKRFEDIIEIDVARDFNEALELMDNNNYIHVISDLRMPGSDPELIIREISERFDENNRTFTSMTDYPGLHGFIKKQVNYYEPIVDRVAQCLAL
jgi:YesN/AraC family two-component response regulator